MTLTITIAVASAAPVRPTEIRTINTVIDRALVGGTMTITTALCADGTELIVVQRITARMAAST